MPFAVHGGKDLLSAVQYDLNEQKISSCLLSYWQNGTACNNERCSNGWRWTDGGSHFASPSPSHLSSIKQIGKLDGRPSRPSRALSSWTKEEVGRKAYGGMNT